MANPHSSTAIIIGGGVIGLSTAYHLAKKKFGKVILLEKERIGEGASSRAAGIITGLLWTKTGVEARRISLRLYRELSEELDLYGYRFRDEGCLNLFDAEQWQEREALLPLYHDCDVPYEILDTDEMCYRWSDLSPAPNLVGLYDPLGGYSEPDLYISALAQRCRDLGVDIREGWLVEDLLVRNGNVVGVMTREGELEADIVISSVHVWTLKLLNKQNISFPIKAFVHQRYVSNSMPSPLNIPAVNANPYGGYVRPADGNRILVGVETALRQEFDVPNIGFQMLEIAGYGNEFQQQLRESMSNLVTRLKETNWETEKIGLLSFSMDGEPILGSVSSLPGLLVAASFHSGGFAYNPVVGLLLAEIVVDGKTSIDISDFSPMRFDADDTSQYLAKTISQQDAVSRRH